MLDLTAGDFLAGGTEASCGYGGSGRVHLLGEELQIALPFDPVAIDAGDGDGHAEIVAIGAHRVRICDFMMRSVRH